MRGWGWSPTVEKQVRLVQKVKRLLRRAGQPRWLHRFGPKKYEFWQHMLALLVRQICQLSYRRVVRLLRDLGVVVPSYSALIKMACRLPAGFWQRVLAATRSGNVCVAAVDSTTFARSNPSYHYLRRIDQAGPAGVPVKANVLVDTRRKKIVSAYVRVLPRADPRDVPALLKKCHPKTLVADKGYDSEAVHEHCFERGIISMIPARKNVRSGFYRRKQLRKFKLRVYHRREMSESKFSSVKRCYGSTIRCRRARAIKSELFTRFTASNIFSRALRHFHQSHARHNLYIPTESVLHLCSEPIHAAS